MGLTLHKRRVKKGGKQGGGRFIPFSTCLVVEGPERKESFQLKSKLSRSKSLKLAIEIFLFAYFLNSLLLFLVLPRKVIPFLAWPREMFGRKKGTHGRTYK
jgi:hypothetical protein